MTRSVSRALLIGLCAVASLELGASALVYRQRIGPQDWRALDRVVAEMPATEPVLLAQPWLGPRARMAVPGLRGHDRVAPPDLRGIARFHTVGLDDVWSSSLERVLDGGARPTLVTTSRAGALIVATWSMPAERTLWNWTEHVPPLATDGGQCNGRGPWKCPNGRVKLEYGEVGYLPRYALWANLGDGATLTAADDVVLGDQLRGHVGFADFNARLRSDGPVRVVVRIDGSPALRFIATDSQAWLPFEVQTSRGPARVEVAITSAVRGTWGRKGYGASPIRTIGLELRALQATP